MRYGVVHILDYKTDSRTNRADRAACDLRRRAHTPCGWSNHAGLACVVNFIGLEKNGHEQRYLIDAERRVSCG